MIATAFLFPPHRSGVQHLYEPRYVYYRLALASVNPVNLRGLKQAVFVLHGLESGKSARDLADDFGGDKQLVELWTSFLIHNNWIKRTENDEVVITDKGKDWLSRISEAKAT